MKMPVVDPELETLREDKTALVAAMKRIEEWGRFNDSHIRRIAIDALVAVRERDQ